VITGGGRKDAWLFGEGQSRVAVTVALDKIAIFEDALGDIPFEKKGVVTTGEIVIDGDFWGTIDWWQEKYDTAIENYLTKESAGSALIPL
jgi:phosphoribosylformylglycinamidine synthase subunit PurL